MESQREKWTSAHAQLWTSFKRAQERHGSSEHRGEDCINREIHISSASDPQPMSDCGLTSRMLSEVSTRLRLDESVFSEEVVTRILEVIDNARTENSVRDLLLTTVHLKNRLERANAAAVYRQESITGAVHDALFHLSGQRPTTSGASKGESEYTEALAEIENQLFVLLVQIEKCKEMVFTLAQNSGMDEAIYSGNSMQETLNLLCSSSSSFPVSKTWAVNPDLVEQNHTMVLKQVMDILGAPPDADLNQAPDLALRVARNLEFVQRENDINSAILLQYERTVLDRFASCGVVSPPTVENAREALLSNGAGLRPSLDDQWIKDHLVSLVSAMYEVNESCHLGVVPIWLIKGPTDTSAEAVFKYMRSSLSAGRELLLLLARDRVEAKKLLSNMSYRLSKPGPEGGGASQVIFTDEMSLIDIIQEFGRLLDCQSEKQILGASVKECQDKSLDMMMRIVRWLPDDNQRRSLELEKDRDALTEYVEGVVKQLAAPKRMAVDVEIVRQIEELNVQVARLLETIHYNEPPFIDQTALSTLVDVAKQLWHWVIERCEVSKAQEDNIIQQCLHELAQLLPTGVTPSLPASAARIVPPVNSLFEMIQLLKRRQEQWVQEQQKQQLSGAQSRLEKARVEEAVRERGKQLVKITRDILSGTGISSDMDEILGVLSGEKSEETAVLDGKGNSGRGGSAFSITAIFDDLEERLRLIKVRYQRLMQSYTANKVRLDNLVQSTTAHGKRWTRICCAVGAICHVVGLDELATHLELDSKADVAPSFTVTSATSAAAPTTSKHMLRPDHKTHTAQPVTDANLLEALKLVGERLKEDDALGDSAAQKSEILRLLEEKKRWTEEMDIFHRAMCMMSQRLAEGGRRIKRCLFLLGTDESAEDDVVERIMMGHLHHGEDEEDEEGSEGDNAGTSEGTVRRTNGQGKNKEANEELLAVLLQKFGRWTTRLQEATEDHLYTQQKLLKYFAPLHRLFCAGDKAAQQQDTTDENLIDIDTTLMGFADEILPVLNRAISATKTFTADDKDNSGSTRGMALSMLLHDTKADCVLPTDHRLIRLYETVGKLRTMVAGLLSVRYLSIPSSSRRRSGGAADELVFEDALGEDYVELDFGKAKDSNINGNNNTETERSNGDGKNEPILNDDILFQAVESNILNVYQALGVFSTNYKLAAILVQKDTEMIQQFVAAMLEPYTQLDVERAFHQNSEVLNEMYVLISERATRQRGCYFFSRVGGKGPCVWAAALEQLSIGFVGILEKLQKRTQAATELRELVDDVVDLCAMYVNWVNVSGGTLLSSHPLPQDVVDTCVREDEVMMGKLDVQHRDQHQEQGETMNKPPLPPSHEKPKVSHFLREEVVLKVISHMFQMAQEISSCEGEKKDTEEMEQLNAQVQQMKEEIQLLRETAAVSEQRANMAIGECRRMEEGRDKALSEAAVSRAELRRWKRQHGIFEEQAPPPQRIPSLSPSPSPPLPPSSEEQQQNQRFPVSEKDHKGTAHAAATDPHSLPPPLSSTGGNESSDGNTAKQDSFFLMAQSMKELTEELRSVCKQGILSSNQAAVKAGCKEATVRKGLKPRAQEPSPRSFGLVRSPKGCKIVSSVQGAVYPRSSSSSPLPPTTKGSNRSHPDLDTGLARQCVQHECLSIPCASVSVVPERKTYSSLVRDQNHNSHTPSRRVSTPHYKTCDHRGRFFNECEVCCRHHSSRKCTGSKLPQAAASVGASLSGSARSSSHLRSQSPRKRLPTRSSHTLSEAVEKTRSFLGGAELKTPRGGVNYHHQHHFQVQQGVKHARAAETSAKRASPRYPEGGVVDISSQMKKRSHFATEKQDCYSHHGEENGLLLTSSLRAPSTSTALSPESVPTLTESVEDYHEMRRHQYNNQHPHGDQHKQKLRGQNGNQQCAALTSGEREEFQLGTANNVNFEDRPEFFGQRRSATRRLVSPHGETGERRLEDQQERKGRRNARILTSPTKTVHDKNSRSEAVKKLADIVSKTKIFGTVDL